MTDIGGRLGGAPLTHSQQEKIRAIAREEIAEALKGAGLSLAQIMAVQEIVDKSLAEAGGIRGIVRGELERRFGPPLADMMTVGEKQEIADMVKVPTCEWKAEQARRHENGRTD